MTDADLSAYQLYVDDVLVGTVGTGTTRCQVGALATGHHSAWVVADRSGMAAWTSGMRDRNGRGPVTL